MTQRRTNDAYYTPAWQTRALLAHQEISGTVLEPCAGDMSIAREIQDAQWRAFNSMARPLPPSALATNDVNGSANFSLDASSPELYQKTDCGGVGPIDWVITNPPYKMPLCLGIVKQAVAFARVGVAMLLRISFAEPTKLRGPWLQANPVSRRLTLPRHSYTGNGSTDSATTEWYIWLKRPLRADEPPILSLYDADRRYAEEPVA